MMSPQNSLVGIFDRHTQAETAIKELQRAGFNMKELSILGKDYEVDEDVVGYYTTGDRMAYWGKNGAFWGGLWGFLFGSAFFMVPGIGPFLMFGPIVSWVVGALEGAVLVGGVSAIGAGLYGMGIPEQNVLKYETSLKAGKFMLVAHGTQEEVTRAKAILAAAGASETRLHTQNASEAALV
jgi:hypothetical protein